MKEQIAGGTTLLSAHETLAILFLDLDGFKNVDGTDGHAEGDSVLREVARRLLMRSRDELISCVDTAMYRAKKQGTGCLYFDRGES